MSPAGPLGVGVGCSFLLKMQRFTSGCICLLMYVSHHIMLYYVVSYYIIFHCTIQCYIRFLIVV